jgi:hypothetical protein
MSLIDPLPTCEYHVHWWDIDVRETCRRERGHAGAHTDGCWHFDNEGLRVPRDPEDTS